MEILNPAEMFRPRGYSHAARVTGAATLLFIAGQTAQDAQEQIIGKGDIARQTDKALENLVTVLRDAGAGPEHIASMTWYVTDLADYQQRLGHIGQVYLKHLGKRFPPITMLEVKRLWHPDMLIEVEATAAL